MLRFAIRGSVLLGVGLWPTFVGCTDDFPTPSGSYTKPVAVLGFVEFGEESGFAQRHFFDAGTVNGYQTRAPSAERDLLERSGGIATADVDQDGWHDVFVLRGQAGGALLMNRQDGTFRDETEAFGIETGPFVVAPLFGDFDGDAYPDLVLGGFGDQPLTLWLNLDGESFEEATDDGGLGSIGNIFGAGAGDADGDGDLDLLLARYGATPRGDAPGLFWLNDGFAHFTDASNLLPIPTATVPEAEDDPNARGSNRTDAGALVTGARAILTDGGAAPSDTGAKPGDAGVPPSDAGLRVDAGGMPDPAALHDVALVPSFADLDGDGDQDVTLVQERGLSAVFLNETRGGELRFERVQPALFDVPHAHASSLGDYDNDGDLDWFIGAVAETDAPGFDDARGNRLYQNDGDGNFEDVTDDAGIEDGGFAWASCFADFNNDGHLDLFQVSGTNDGTDARPRLFLNQRDGTFEEAAMQLDIDDAGNGRGLACFDYDHDGDVDVFVNNSFGVAQLYGNTLNPWGRQGANYVCVSLHEDDPEQTIIGSRVEVQTSGDTQLREVRLDNSYVSQGSIELHFGIGGPDVVDRIDILWADGDDGTVLDWPSNNCLQATHLPE